MKTTAKMKKEIILVAAKNQPKENGKGA